MNWSRSDTKSSFESLMGDSANTDIKWFYSEDDELGMGILEALAGGGIDDATKTAFLGNKPVITGCGGLGEFYDVLKGTGYADIAGQLGVQPVHDQDSNPGYGRLPERRESRAGSRDRMRDRYKREC